MQFEFLNLNLNLNLSMYQSFTDMPVWKMAHSLSISIFHLTDKLPQKEDYGLTSQIRRSACSIPANIAEAYGRSTKKDKQNFYIIARGSAFETINHILYAEKVGYIKETKSSEILSTANNLIHDLNKILKSLN